LPVNPRGRFKSLVLKSWVISVAGFSKVPEGEPAYATSIDIATVAASNAGVRQGAFQKDSTALVGSLDKYGDS
jgi:hypothetical protein